MLKGRRINYRSFESAKKFARSLRLRNKDEWTRYAKGEMSHLPPKPTDIPSRVDKIFKGNGWSGFDDFLGTAKSRDLSRNFRSFESARAFARTLKLNNTEEWKEYVEGKRPDLKKLPDDVPANPDEIYRDKGWVSYADWLKSQYTPVLVNTMDFKEAREYVRKLGLKSIQEWDKFRNGEDKTREPCPQNIPVWPPHAYRDSGWTNWSDWLGLNIGPRF